MASLETQEYGIGTQATDHSQVAARQDSSHAHQQYPDIAGGVVPGVRLTGVLVEDGRILLVKQELAGGSRAHWTLPGGMLELGETLQQCLQREMREETGLEVEVGDLLYISDRFRSMGHHIVDVSFALRRVGGILLESSMSDNGREVLSQIEMVPVDSIVAHGFSERFQDTVAQGFPARGSYVGDFHEFY